MPERMSEYMPERMSDTMSELIPYTYIHIYIYIVNVKGYVGILCQGGDHSKKVSLSLSLFPLSIHIPILCILSNILRQAHAIYNTLCALVLEPIFDGAAWVWAMYVCRLSNSFQIGDTYTPTRMHPQTHTHTYIHTYIHTCTHACIHAYMHAYRQTWLGFYFLI